MTKFDCMRIHGLLDRRAAGLSAAEALRLEEHLSSCGRCSRDAALLDGLRKLATTEHRSLTPVAREQLIRRAFIEAEALPPAGSRRLWPAFAVGSLTLAAAAAAFVLIVQRGAPDPVASHDTPERERAQGSAKPSAQVDLVLSGTIEVDGEPSAPGTQLAAHDLLHAKSPAKLALGHAEVELAAGTTLRWNREQRHLRLESGRVLAEVDPGAHQSFTVETPRFTVLVLGTRFEVTLDAVRVERGRVRVVSTAGTELAASLGAGEELVVPAGFEDPDEAAVDASDEPARRDGARATRVQPARRPDAADLIGQARAYLAERRVGDARRSLDAALASTRTPSERAEAMSLRAECALVEGDLGTAIEAYLRVARAYASHPAGQNALFAAARLEAERGRSAAAITLLERYLSRYPDGRFVKEARTRLRELGAVLDHRP